jgi:outer membrane immunogenic protein
MLAAMGMPAAPAQAADIIEPVVPQVAPVVIPTWAGFYIGGFVSGHFGDAEVDGPFGIDADVDIDGILGGVLGGWNFHAPGSNWVFGIEADWGWGEIDGEEDCDLPLCRVDDFDIHQAGHVRGRIGWAGWNPNVLLFAAGGAAFAEGQLRIIDLFPAFSGFDEQWHTGWTVGGGLDWKITPHLVFRAEYLFDNFGDEDYDIGINEINVDVDQVHTIRGALIWKF